MNKGMKVISIITFFAIMAFLVQTNYAYSQNSTRMKIYVTNLTITKSWSDEAGNTVENQGATSNYIQGDRQPNLVGLLIAIITLSLIMVMLSKMASRMKASKSKRKHKSKFSKSKRFMP